MKLANCISKDYIKSFEIYCCIKPSSFTKMKSAIPLVHSFVCKELSSPLKKVGSSVCAPEHCFQRDKFAHDSMWINFRPDVLSKKIFWLKIKSYIKIKSVLQKQIINPLFVCWNAFALGTGNVTALLHRGSVCMLNTFFLPLPYDYLCNLQMTQ